MSPTALTIGNFDGLHAGHLRIMARVAEIAREHGWTPAVLTFDPHPTRVVAPAKSPKLITTMAEREKLIRACGIERVMVLPFTAELARLTPAEFARQVLRDKLDARAVLVGANFRFGAGQAGDVATLRALGEELGFFTEVIHDVERRGRVVSSTSIRRAVEQGQVVLAGRLLDRPFAIEGDVVSGRGVGSKQTVPTLNLSTEAELLPAPGVYITRTTECGDMRRVWDSITNIGYRPTFEDGRGLTIETFLLSTFEGEKPKRIRLEVLRRLREERKFESPEALKTQIFKDVTRAQAYFRRLRRWTGETCRSPKARSNT